MLLVVLFVVPLILVLLVVRLYVCGVGNAAACSFDVISGMFVTSVLLFLV